MENKITVEIGGTSYRFITDEAPERTLAAAAYYNERLEKVGAGDRLPALKASVLAGLTLTQEYLQLRESAEKLMERYKTVMAENAEKDRLLAELNRNDALAESENTVANEE